MKISENYYQVTELRSEYGETLFHVFINTGLAWLIKFAVLAYSEGEAIEKVAKYMLDNGIMLYYTDATIGEACMGNDEPLDEFIERMGLVYADNGIYIPLQKIRR